MTTSTIPAAIDGLLALCAAEATLAGVLIHDGTPMSDEDAEYVAIGYSDVGDGNVESVSARQEPATLGNLRRSETADINCQVCAWSGDTDMKAVRDRAFELFGGVETAVRSDGTLGGAVIFADIGSYSIRQLQTTTGALVLINFTVVIKITRI